MQTKAELLPKRSSFIPKPVINGLGRHSADNGSSIQLSVNNNTPQNFLNDFNFLPKLVHMSKDVSDMVNQGVKVNEIGDLLKDRLRSSVDDPRVIVNINIFVGDKPCEDSTSDYKGNDSPLFSRDLDNNKFETHKKSESELKTPDPNASVNTIPLKIQLPKSIRTLKQETVTLKTPDPNPQLFSTPEPKQQFLPLIHKIKKKRLCNCIKKKSLEDLIKHERLFNKQVDKLKYFWRGTNNNHLFTFKRKMMEYYEETDEVVVNEIVDFSKKAITAEDSFM